MNKKSKGRMWRPAIFVEQIVVSETYFTNDSHSSAGTALLHTFIHPIRAVGKKILQCNSILQDFNLCVYSRRGLRL